MSSKAGNNRFSGTIIGVASTLVVAHDSNLITTDHIAVHNFGAAGGTVVGILSDDDTAGSNRTFYIPAGGVLPFRFKRIHTSSGLAATLLMIA